MPSSKYTGSTYQIDTYHLEQLGEDEDEDFDVPDSKGIDKGSINQDPRNNAKKSEKESLYERQNSLTDLFFS